MNEELMSEQTLPRARAGHEAWVSSLVTSNLLCDLRQVSFFSGPPSELSRAILWPASELGLKECLFHPSLSALRHERSVLNSRGPSFRSAKGDDKDPTRRLRGCRDRFLLGRARVEAECQWILGWGRC